MDRLGIFQNNLSPLRELVGDADLEGIWVPDDLTSEEVNSSIHSLFREKAKEYVRSYQKTHHFEGLLRDAFERAGFRRFDEPLRIVDLCSGAGNSVLPLLAMFPGAEVIALDLSVELLAILRQLLVHQGTADRCMLVQMNAERLELADGTVDLVVGAAALHHLFRPDRTIASCGRILRRGGLAVFFEPFEVGFIYMKLLYERILSDPRSGEIDKPVREFLEALLIDINRRRGEDKSDPIYKQVDDKWIFTTHYFREHGRRSGFASCTIYSLLSGQGAFEEKMVVLLEAGIKRQRDALPGWAWDCVLDHDRLLSPEGHLDCLYEAGVIFQK